MARRKIRVERIEAKVRQLLQKLGSGRPRIVDVPPPVLSDGCILVRNHYSVISAGTEGSTVRTARKSLIAKARSRPRDVQQVLRTLRRQGPIATYRAVKNRLEAYSPLGYSCSGVVVDVAPDIAGFRPGDRVACAGNTANHAEVVRVPKNLCVKLAADADLHRAAYNTLGAIAMQGVRQADVRLGESCAVIGLGILGQLTCLLLRASGVTSFGVDIDPFAVEQAAGHSADLALRRDSPGLAATLRDRTGGLGVDAVIITAGTDSLDPINFAGELCRKRGRVVVVGAVPTGFDRDPHYYRKELELRMSCSYGPGRYDPTYEDHGIDYPAGYVRWTENRNMRAFQSLLESGALDLDYLTTHRIPFGQASDAYELILNGSEPHLGILLEYDADRDLGPATIPVGSAATTGNNGISFIGAGSYAQNSLLPNLASQGATLRGVMTSSGASARRVAERFSFSYCTNDPAELLSDSDTSTVFVATRHDLHASYVIAALESGKHVFVEKPLCLSREELARIEDVVSRAAPQRQLLVGYNRRFAPLARDLRNQLNPGPVAMFYRVYAGPIPKDSWIQDPATGGGRILGEVCHFVDFLTWLCRSLPESVHAFAMRDPDELEDTVTVNLAFANGSIGTICYYANASADLAKEHVEVSQAGRTIVLDNFQRIHGSGKQRRKGLKLSKGQPEMLAAFLESLESGTRCIEPTELFAVMRATLLTVDSLRTGRSLQVESSSDGR